MEEQIISFRLAKFDDISAIMAIEEESFKKGVQEQRVVFENRIKLFPDGFIIMCENNEVIGYACGEIWSQDVELSQKTFALGHNPFDLHNVDGNLFYVSSMGILKANRGGGKGKLLFNALIANVVAKYKNINELILIVADNWEPAKNIYYKQGFQKIMVIDGFFSPKGEAPIDGIVMNKKI